MQEIPMYHPVLSAVITQSQMHVQIIKAFSSISTRFNPYFDWYKIYMQSNIAEAGISYIL